MDNSSLNATEIAVGSLLANRGGGGYGGGAWGGGVGGPFADFSSNAVRINRNNEVNRMGIDGVRDLTELNMINDKFSALNSSLGVSNINSLREMSDLSRQIAECCCNTQLSLKDMTLENFKCCCETQKLIQSDGQLTRDLINAKEIQRLTDANNITATIAPIIASQNANTAAIIAAIQAIPTNGV